MPLSVSIFVSCQLPLWPSSCHSDSKCHRSHGCQEDHEERSQGLQDDQGGAQGGAQDHGHQDQGPEEARSRLGEARHSSRHWATWAGSTAAIGATARKRGTRARHGDGPSRGRPSGPSVAHRRPPHPEVPRVLQLPNFSPQGLYPDPLHRVRNPLAPQPAKRRPGLALVKPARPPVPAPRGQGSNLVPSASRWFFFEGHRPLAHALVKKVGVHLSMFSLQVYSRVPIIRSLAQHPSTAYNLGFRGLLGFTGLGWRV